MYIYTERSDGFSSLLKKHGKMVYILHPFLLLSLNRLKGLLFRVARRAQHTGKERWYISILAYTSSLFLLHPFLYQCLFS
jgi:hypothetical protein